MRSPHQQEQPESAWVVASSTSSFSLAASQHGLFPKRPTRCCQDTPGAKETPSEQHKARHAETTNPCRLGVFLVFGLTTIQSAISLSSAGHRLNTEFPLGLGFPPWPCVRASCVPIFPEEPTSLWLAHLRHSMPYITSHLGNGTAPAPSKARAVCVARLKLLGNTSNTVQSASLRLWQTHQDLARCCWKPAHGGNRPSCPLARAKALQSA